MSSYTIPNVIAQHPRGERIMDVYSHLLTSRIVYLGTAVDPGVANTLIAQLIHLEWESTEEEINLYINCEGGDLPSMLALYDTMQYIQAPVATTCVGQAIAAGAVLLAGGAPGRRAMLPHARVVLHQPVDSGRGTIPDMILQADEIVRMRAEIESILSKHTGQSVQALRTDTDRDRVLTAQASLEYGIVDQILASRPLRGEGLRGCDLAQVARHLLGQLGEGHVERAGQGGDHLAGRLLAATLDLRQVLRRDPGPGRRLRQRLPLVQAQAAEAAAQDLAPQRLP
jgi:ATP-dependent Clp protease protease subunit